MASGKVFVLAAEGDDEYLNVVASELRELGWAVEHSGTVPIGDSLVGQAKRALASGTPVVLCATFKSVGTEWTYRFVNAAMANPVPVLAIKMEAGVLLDHLILRERYADYASDASRAIAEVHDALSRLQPRRRPNATKSANAGPLISAPASSTDLDVEAIGRYLADVREEAAHLRNLGVAPIELFRQTLLVTPDGLPAKAALLLFGKHPQVELPGAIVQCAHFDARDTTERGRTVRILGGAIAQIDTAYEFVRSRVAAGEVTDARSAQLGTRYSYPMKCIREVLVNAVVHRDYDDARRHIHVRLFSDRLEISSPGDWVGISLDDTNRPLGSLSGESVPRNPAFAHAMSLVRYYEGEGSGLPTAVKDSLLAGSPEPSACARGGFVVVTVWPSKYDVELVERVLRSTAQDRGLRAIAEPELFIERHIELVSPAGEGSARLTTESTSFPPAGVRNALIVGSAGLGKSTLLAHLSLRAASAGTSLPIFLDLRDCPATLRSLEGFLEWIESAWSARLGVDVARGTARSILEALPAEFLLDGLDEMPQSMAGHLGSVIHDLLASFERSTIIVSSRPGPWEEGLQDWSRFRMVPWSDADVQSYLTRAIPHSELGTLSAGRSEPLRDLMRSPGLAAAAVRFLTGVSADGIGSFSLVGAISAIVEFSILLQSEKGRGTVSVAQARDVYRDLAYASLLEHKDEFSREWMVSVIDRGQSSRGLGREALRSLANNTRILVISRNAAGEECICFAHQLIREILAVERVQIGAGSLRGFVESLRQLDAPLPSRTLWSSATQAWLAAHTRIGRSISFLVGSASESGEPAILAGVLDGIAAALHAGALGDAELSTVLRELDSPLCSAMREQHRLVEEAAQLLRQAVEMRAASR